MSESNAARASWDVWQMVANDFARQARANKKPTTDVQADPRARGWICDVSYKRYEGQEPAMSTQIAIDKRGKPLSVHSIQQYSSNSRPIGELRDQELKGSTATDLEVASLRAPLMSQV